MSRDSVSILNVNDSLKIGFSWTFLAISVFFVFSIFPCWSRHTLTYKSKIEDNILLNVYLIWCAYMASWYGITCIYLVANPAESFYREVLHIHSLTGDTSYQHKTVPISIMEVWTWNRPPVIFVPKSPQLVRVRNEITESTNGVTCADLDHPMKYHIAVITLQSECDISCY